MAKKINLLAWFIICHFGNIADALCTLYAVSKGVEELNPLMAWLISFSPTVFIATKLLIFTFAIDILARAPSIRSVSAASNRPLISYFNSNKGWLLGSA